MQHLAVRRSGGPRVQRGLRSGGEDQCHDKAVIAANMKRGFIDRQASCAESPPPIASIRPRVLQ
jgi:hypothetical protein